MAAHYREKGWEFSHFAHGITGISAILGAESQSNWIAAYLGGLWITIVL